MEAAPPSVIAFRESAANFCLWCESASLGAEPELTAAVWLARLHASALLLPESGPENEEGIPELPSALRAQVERNFSPFVGAYHRTVFDPDPLNTDEPVIGDLGDDLLDVYKDIKAGCLLYERGQLQLALWHWSFMHRIHWGKHAIGALSALHSAARRRAE